jgi:hypothetical protein
MLGRIKEFISARLSEASTLRALTLLSGLLGYTLNPEHGEMVATVVVFVLSLFGIMPDKKKSEAEVAAEEAAQKKAELNKARKLLGLPEEN